MQSELLAKTYSAKASDALKVFNFRVPIRYGILRLVEVEKALSCSKHMT